MSAVPPAVGRRRLPHFWPVIRIGPAGWDYEDWWGRVYPDPAPRGFDPLAWLARFYDLVEINSTHYRPMPAQVAKAWCARVRPFPDFRFTAKLWKRFTHERENALTGEEIGQVREAFEVLHGEGRLGAVLMQFPWSFKRDEAAEEWLWDVARALSGLPLVLEVRHASWNHPDVYLRLREQGIGFVNIDQPLFHRSIKPSAVATSAVGYIRIHGRNYSDWFRKGAGRDARYDYLYKEDELQPWVQRAQAIERDATAKEIYVVTNNHFRGQAAANATMLQSMVRGRRVAAPEPLVRSYREVLERHVEVGTEGEAAAPPP